MSRGDRTDPSPSPRPAAAAAALDRGVRGDRLIDPAIAAGLVGAERDQIAVLLIDREPRAHARRGLGVLVHRRRVGIEPRHARDDVDRREVTALREPAIEHDVAVDDAAHLVGDRLVEIVARDEHRVDRGDRALPCVAPARSTSRGSSANTLGG